MSTTDEQRTTLQALLAVAALGGRFWSGDVTFAWGLTLPQHVADWDPDVTRAVCETREDALACGAYFVERVWLSGDGRRRERYGYRLSSFRAGGTGGHEYSGEVFRTADDFWSAMRTVADMAERAKRQAKTLTVVKTLTVLGRRWRDRKNGNTYHTAEVFVDGRPVWRSPRTYGYEQAYVDTAAEWVAKAGLLPREHHANGSREPLHVMCEKAGIKYSASAVDVPRRKDLEP